MSSMSRPSAVTVRVDPRDGDGDELADLTSRLRAELLDLDVDAVEPLTGEAAPGLAKGLADVAGWLVVHLGTAAGVRTVVDALRAWTARTQREVEISLDGDTLRVTGLSGTEQEKIIDAWLSRHAARA